MYPMNTTHMKQKILALVQQGKSSDLLDLVLGESRHSRSDAGCYLVTGIEAKELHAAAISHLRFLSEFGNAESPVRHNNRLHFAFPEEFSQWLELGAPGLPTADLDRYCGEAV
jgi:hypothetical protein